jgi:uncharacterized protein with ATP-grasp and redox domains
MNTCLTCLPCFIRQALEAARLASADERTTEEVLRRSLRRLSDLPFDKTPPHIVKEIHRIVRDLVIPGDPYKELKIRYNNKALDLLPRMRKAVFASEDSLQTAARLAIAGNIIDFGHLNSDFDISLNEVIEDTLEQSISINRLDDLRRDLKRADRILYLTDNAGEIVFDRLLIEVIDEQFREAFEKSDLIIAKGQGNYETLSETPGNIYFLLKVKCPAIALDLSCQTGDIVITGTGQTRHENKKHPLITDDTVS